MSDPDYAAPPGIFLAEWMENHGITQQQLADRVGCSRKQINEIIHGKAPITSETASRLGRVTTIPARAWLRYEAFYRSELARLAERPKLAAYAHMIDSRAADLLRAVEMTDAADDEPAELVADFLAFHDCGTWEAYETVIQAEVVAGTRTTILGEDRELGDLTVLTTWMGAGALEAEHDEKVAATPSAVGVRALIDGLEAQQASQIERAQATDELAAAGVLLAVVAPPRGFGMRGVQHWFAGRMPIIQLAGEPDADVVDAQLVVDGLRSVLTSMRPHSRPRMRSRVPAS